MEITGSTPRVEDLAALSIREAIARQRSTATLVSNEEQWRLRIVATFGGRLAAEVSHIEAQEAAVAWAAEFGPHAARKAVKEAAKTWRMAVRRGWILRQPWDGVEVPGATPRPQPRMPRADRLALRTHLEPIALHGAPSRLPRVSALAILTMIETCTGRVAETAKLTQDAVDFDAGLIVFTRHKTAGRSGPKRAILSAFQAQIFRACLAAFGGSKWMFPSSTDPEKPIHEVGRSMGRACRQIGLRAWGPHAARRGIATEAMDEGASLEDVQAMLGHASRAETERYIGWTPKRAENALRLVTLGPSETAESEALSA